jgi:ComF family protein
VGAPLHPVPGPFGEGASGHEVVGVPGPPLSAAESLFPTGREAAQTPLRCIADAVLNLIYPDSCFVCAVPVARQQDCGICGTCWGRAVRLRIGPPWCPCCGLPFPNLDPGNEHLCGSCILHPPAYAGARSFGYYTGELSIAIQQFKFRGRRNLAGHLSALLADAFFRSWGPGEIDLLIPVPLHPRRRRQRGFNQAALLAHGLSRLVSVPCSETALSRVRDTKPQVGLSDSDRLGNVRLAFLSKPGEIENRRLLLIDDVMTTGATISSAAAALRTSGAVRISALTVARAVPNL